MEVFKPGQVISPRTSDTTPPSQAPTHKDAANVPAPVTQSSVTPLADQSSSATTEVSMPETNWRFNGAPVDDDTPLPQASDASFKWTASEFIAHEKSAIWYILLGLGALLLSALVYLVTKDVVSTAVVVAAAFALGVFAARKPRVLEYEVNNFGIRVGRKIYPLNDFKSLSVAEEGPIVSVVFMPLKRFMPPLTVYVAPDIEEAVVAHLSGILPVEEHRQDLVDNLLRRIRF